MGELPVVPTIEDAKRADAPWEDNYIDAVGHPLWLDGSARLVRCGVINFDVRIEERSTL